MIDRAAGVIKVMGHPLRLRLLDELSGGEVSVGELAARTGAAQPVVSQQLATLRARGVVDSRSAGALHYYRIVDPRVERVLACLRAS
jgi:ArsR family transcriptional regulator